MALTEAPGYGMVEDGGVGGEPGDRQLVDVALERAAIQQVARDIIEPETLAQVMEQLGRFHDFTSGGIWIDCLVASSAAKS